METRAVIAKGGIEKLGMKGSFLKHKKANGEAVILEGEILDHKAGIEYVLGVLTSKKHGCLKSLDELDAVGHRVVHGGERFNSSVFITDDVIHEMEKCIDLAPLHNLPNLKGIYAMKELVPGIPQVGVFDTAFHQTMEPYVYMYGIPYTLYDKYAIRRYGFHGTSHRYVSHRACEMLGVDYEKQKIITCHLGNGASVAAIKDGRSFDTSMGFTPVEGLMMGTRSGDIDLGAVLYIMDKEQIGTKTATALFNKHSGLLGITGVSSDMRDVEAAAGEGNQKAIMAIQMYCYRVRKYIGAYAAAMGGLDMLIFTGGIGENSFTTRRRVCEGLEFLGIDLDDAKNVKQVDPETHCGCEMVINKENAPIKVVCVPTNEELVIAIDTQKIIETR